MRVFVAQANDLGFYGFDQALRSLDLPDLQVMWSYARGARFPLTRPLPRRLERAAQAYAYPGLLAYDLLILAGVDPASIPLQDLAGVVSLVEHGGGVLLIGGPHSLGDAGGTYEPLRAILPVEVQPASSRVLDAGLERAAEHVVMGGLPLDALGRVRILQPITPKAGAVVLLRASGFPLLVAGECGRGRVLVLATYPDVPDGLDGSLFVSPFYDDLLRQAILWLTRREPPVVIRRFEVATRPVQPGEEVTAHLALASNSAQTVRVLQTLRHESDTRVIYEQRLEIEGESVLTVPLRAGTGPDAHGHHEAVLQVRSAEGMTLARRDWLVDVVDPHDFAVRFLAHQDVFAPATPLELRVHASRRELPLTWRAAVVDAAGAQVASFAPAALPAPPGDAVLALPNLASGSYRLVAELLGGDAVVSRCTRDFHVVDPLPASDFFSISAEAGNVHCDAALIRHHIDDVLVHGFNTVVITGRHTHAVELDKFDWEQEQLWMRLLKEQERYAQLRGAAVAYNYAVLPQSFSRSAPMTHCLRAPGHEDVLRQKLQHQIRTAMRVPRLVSLEILDEPLVRAASVCRCEHCRQQYAECYGRPLPTHEDLEALPERARRDYFAFLSDYWSEEFRLVHQLARAVNPSPTLNLTLCGTSFGLYNPLANFSDAVAWARHCDWIDFDIYPYMYPHFRAAAHLPMQSVHYHFGGHRMLAWHYGKPLGFFVEIEDRNYPQHPAPVHASVEVLYTALAQGADYLKTFINLPYDHAPTRERWDALGVALQQVERYSALLCHVARPRARIAMLFGYTDWLLRPQTRSDDLPPGGLTWDDRPYDGYWPYNRARINAFELLVRAFGEADLIPEQLVDSELHHYRALLVTGLVYLPRAVVQELARFVAGGGLLLTDGLPQRDEDGLTDVEPFATAAVTETVEIDGALRAHVSELGDGCVIRFTQDLADAYAAAFESDDPVRWCRMEDTVRHLLFARGLRPAARAEHPDVEVGWRRGQGCGLLVLVNHAGHTVATRVLVYEPGFAVNWMADPATGAAIAFGREDGAVVLDVELDGRCGRAVALHAARPHANCITVRQPVFRAGEMLSYAVQVLDETQRPAPGQHVVEIEVTDPAGVRRPRYGGQRVTSAGELQVEVQLAVNERPGVWDIAVCDRLTRARSSAEFTLLGRLSG